MDYSSNIILQEKSKRPQAIYASQLYQTFFGVFARFDVKKDTDPNKMWIEKIYFTLINFKGILNIQIQNEKNPNWLTLENFKEDGELQGYQINIPVQHTKTAEPIQFELPFDLTKLSGTKQDPKKLTVKGKGLLVEKGKILRIERILLPIHPNKAASNLEKSSYKGVFDAEFYRRDGNYYDNLKPFKHDNRNVYDGRIGSYPSPRCVPANNLIHFD